MTSRWRDPEKLLLPPVRVGVALVLLTPLVWAPWTLYPFPVGKAVYARALIAAAFALWAILALLRPQWRPPRSALFGRARRSRRRGLAGLGGVGAVVVVLVLVLALRGEAPSRAFDNPMLERATSAERIGFTAGNRFRNWEAGMKAFAERPLLGWGSGNYHVASGRYISAPEGHAKVRDQAHNLLVEEAASRGVAGLAAWLALWGLTALVVLRAARRPEDPRERALAVFAKASEVSATQTMVTA